jgi:predicted RNase H-like HicB family nuclease
MIRTHYAYPAQFVNEDNGTVTVFFPDLEGCCTYDSTVDGAALMAKEALELYLDVLLEKDETIPKATPMEKVKVDNGCVMMVVADVSNLDEENKPVEKMLTIPRWLDREATKAHLNFSNVLKDALIERIGLL